MGVDEAPGVGVLVAPAVGVAAAAVFFSTAPLPRRGLVDFFGSAPWRRTMRSVAVPSIPNRYARLPDIRQPPPPPPMPPQLDSIIGARPRRISCMNRPRKRTVIKDSPVRRTWCQMKRSARVSATLRLDCMRVLCGNTLRRTENREQCKPLDAYFQSKRRFGMLAASWVCRSRAFV